MTCSRSTKYWLRNRCHCPHSTSHRTERSFLSTKHCIVFAGESATMETVLCLPQLVPDRKSHGSSVNLTATFVLVISFPRWPESYDHRTRSRVSRRLIFWPGSRHRRIDIAADQALVEWRCRVEVLIHHHRLARDAGSRWAV